jgi:hypothetical protein
MGDAVKHRDDSYSSSLILSDSVQCGPGYMVLRERWIGMILLRTGIGLHTCQLMSIPIRQVFPAEPKVLLSTLRFGSAHFFSFAGNILIPITAKSAKMSYVVYV